MVTLILKKYTQLIHILLDSWEAQEYWNGSPISSPAGLPDPGIKPGSHALQADFWPTELSGKPS